MNFASSVERLWFISDIHLSQDKPHITKIFKEFLAVVEHNSAPYHSHLFILGDLFETWIGDDDDSIFHQEIKKILIDFTSNGFQTYFIHGNRDFLIGKDFANEVGIKILSDPYTITTHRGKYILSHGDFLCTSDLDYMDFRAMVRSEKWQKNFLSKNLDERRLIASSMRSNSKKASSKKSPEVTDVDIESVNNFFEENEFCTLIHGHTHRPKIHKHGHSNRRIVLGDWDKSGWYFCIFNTIDYTKRDLEEFRSYEETMHLLRYS